MQISRVDQVLIALAAVLIVAMGTVGWISLAPAEDTFAMGQGEAASGVLIGETGPAETPDRQGPVSASGAPIIVDVEGAVVRPGLYHLVSGARVGDAIAAAGGYDSSVDLDAAALELNLAAHLEDGEKVVVPRLRAPDEGGAGSGSGSAEEGSGGLVNVNTADAAELEELPGIGPVTVDKIIAARQEAPFTSLEEMVERDVINNGQLEKIRDLATAD